jgi:hypothetical protein
MHAPVRAIPIAVLATFLTASSWLAPLDARAAALPVEVDFTIRLAFGMYAGGSLSVSGGGTAIVNGSGAGGQLVSLALPAALFATTGLAVPVTDPAAFPVNGLQLTVANGAGSAAEDGGGFGGAMPLAGVFRLCLYFSCDAPPANLSIPLTPVGVGGTATVAGPVNVSVFGAPWTRGTAMVGAFGILTVRFVPEPAMALLFGAGIAALGAIGRRR